jgi:hypothetical protein
MPLASPSHEEKKRKKTHKAPPSSNENRVNSQKLLVSSSAHEAFEQRPNLMLPNYPPTSERAVTTEEKTSSVFPKVAHPAFF